MLHLGVPRGKNVMFATTSRLRSPNPLVILGCPPLTLQLKPDPAVSRSVSTYSCIVILGDYIFYFVSQTQSEYDECLLVLRVDTLANGEGETPMTISYDQTSQGPMWCHGQVYYDRDRLPRCCLCLACICIMSLPGITSLPRVSWNSPKGRSSEVVSVGRD